MIFSLLIQVFCVNLSENKYLCARCSHISASCNSIAARLSCNCLIIAACKPCKMTLSEVCNFPNCLSKVERELIAGNLTLKNLLRHNFVSFAASLLIFILLNPDLTWGGGCRLSLFPAQLFSVVWLSVAVSGVSYDPRDCDNVSMLGPCQQTTEVLETFQVSPCIETSAPQVTITNSLILCHWKHRNFMPLS